MIDYININDQLQREAAGLHSEGDRFVLLAHCLVQYIQTLLVANAVIQVFVCYNCHTISDRNGSCH